MHIKLLYEAPESILLSFPAEKSICTGSPDDKPGDNMEEDDEYWYEY